jgi:hypothetical protein
LGGIQWNEAIVIRELAKSPNFWEEATTRHNLLFRHKVEQINGTAFDPESTMLHFFLAEWTIKGVATKATEVLSKADRQFIAGAKMYPKKTRTVDSATPFDASIPARAHKPRASAATSAPPRSGWSAPVAAA